MNRRATKLRKCVHLTCFLLGFFRLSVTSARASDDDLTPDKRDRNFQQDRDDDEKNYVSARDRKVGVGDVDIYARYAHAARGQSANGLTDLASIGFDTRGYYGKQAGYAFGLGFQLGMGVGSSFIYDAHISPVGWGVGLGHSGFLMLLGGVGIDGATSRIPASATLPVQALLAFDIQRRVRVGFDGTITWVTNSDRENGARILGSGDEFDLGASIRIGKSLAMDQFNMGRGYFFRVDRKEQFGTTFFGLSVGLEIDGSG
jgi:hypothetical protein